MREEELEGMALMLMGSKQGQVRRIQQTGRSGQIGRLAPDGAGGWTTDQGWSCGEHERGANGFLTSLGTLHLGGQPVC